MNKKTLTLLSDLISNKNKEESLKTLLSTPSKEINKNKNIKEGIDLGYKLTPIIRKDITISNNKLIDDTFNIYFKFNNKLKNEGSGHELPLYSNIKFSADRTQVIFS